VADFSISGIKISAIAAAVPKARAETTATQLLATEQERQKYIKNIGIRSRRIAPDNVTAADLCQLAAEKILAELQWHKADVQLLVMVTQTPDYITPCTAVLLQDRLGLPQSCLCFDINLGCSAFPYGLATAASLLRLIPDGKGLLLIGDKSSLLVSAQDKSTGLLFSDAGSAIALTRADDEQQIHFTLASDGSGYEALLVKGGGARHPTTVEQLALKKIGEGVVRNDLNLQMNGIAIFNFALKQVVPSIHAFFARHHLSPATLDAVVLHQANKIINESMRKTLHLSKEQTLDILSDFGNASSASIPLALVVGKPPEFWQAARHVFTCGFGVGLSWGCARFTLQDIPYIPLLEV